MRKAARRAHDRTSSFYLLGRPLARRAKKLSQFLQSPVVVIAAIHIGFLHLPRRLSYRPPLESDQFNHLAFFAVELFHAIAQELLPILNAHSLASPSASSHFQVDESRGR